MGLDQQLNHLEMAGLIRLVQLYPELEYFFRHAMVQEATYNSLLKQDRRRLHELVAQRLEVVYANRLDGVAAMLAHHYEEAGDDQRASQYYRRAGRHAMTLYANPEAEQHFRRALLLTPPVSLADRAGLLVQIGETQARRGHFDEAVASFKQAVAMFKELRDWNSLADAHARIVQTMSAAGDLAVATNLAAEAIKGLPATLENEGMAALLQQAGRVHFLSGLPLEALSYSQKAQDLGQKFNLPAVQADALATIGGLLQSQGEVESAIPQYHAAMKIADAHNLPYQYARAVNNLGNAYTRRGEVKRALEYLLQGAERARRADLTAMEMFVLCNAGYQTCYLGDFEQHEQIMNRMREISDQHAPQAIWALQILSNECLAQRFHGHYDEANEGLQNILRAFRSAGDWQMISDVGSVLGEMLLEAGRWSEAKTVLEEGIAAARKLAGGLTIVVSLCNLAGGHSLYGEVDQARALIDEVRGITGGAPTPLEERSLALAEARLAAAEKRWSEAFAAYERAAKSARDQSIRWLEAYAMLEWAGTLAKRGKEADRSAARDLLDQAEAIFREIGTTYYLTRIDTQRAAL